MIRAPKTGTRIGTKFGNSWLAKAGLFSVFGSILFAVVALAQDDAIQARISPIGEVCIQGDSCDSGSKAVNTASLVNQAGPTGSSMNPETVYQTYCFACHTTGVNNSPVLGDVAAWEERIAKGMEALYESSLNGFNQGLMPPKGLCMACSDEDLRATVDYIVQSSQ